jgi:hypothetical protein
MIVKQLSFVSLKSKLLLVPDGDEAGKDVLVVNRKDHTVIIRNPIHSINGNAIV